MRHALRPLFLLTALLVAMPARPGHPEFPARQAPAYSRAEGPYPANRPQAPLFAQFVPDAGNGQDAGIHEGDGESEDDRERMRRQMREQWQQHGGFCESAAICAKRRQLRSHHLPQMSPEERARFKESLLRRHKKRNTGKGGFVGPGPHNRQEPHKQ